MNNQPIFDLTIIGLQPGLPIVRQERRPDCFALLGPGGNELHVREAGTKAAGDRATLVGLQLIELGMNSAIVMSLEDAAAEECAAHLVKPPNPADLAGDGVVDFIQRCGSE